MDYIISFILFGGGFALMIGIIFVSNQDWKRRKKVEVSEEVLLPNDCIKAAEQARKVLYDRVCDAQGNPSFAKECGYRTLSEGGDLVDFFRYAHLSGYRVKLIKGTDNNKDKKDEFHITIHKAKASLFKKLYDSL